MPTEASGTYRLTPSVRAYHSTPCVLAYCSTPLILSLLINAVDFKLISQRHEKNLEFNIQNWTWSARLLTVPSHEGLKESKMPKIMDLESTGLRRSARLDNKPRQKYDLITKLSLALIGACGVDNNTHIFLKI